MSGTTMPASDNAVATDPEFDALAIAFAAASDKKRATITDGLMARIAAAFVARDNATADLYAGYMRDLVTAADGVADDYAAAERYASFVSVMADLDANLSDRARHLVTSGTVGASDRLVARLNGLNVTRTAVSDDGARRAGSDEPKGSVKEALIAYVGTLPVGTWATIDAAGKWITDNGSDFGYRSDYVCDGGRIMARNAGNPTAVAWRADNNIEFGRAPLGRGDVDVWCVRRTA